MKCIACGSEISLESKFCKYCGIPILSAEIQNFENEIVDNYIQLTDEDGNTNRFEFLDLITYRKKEYVILLPEDDAADEVIILEVELLDGNEQYIVVENQQILDIIFELFKERNRDFFEFVD